MEEILSRLQQAEEPRKGEVFELLDGIDLLHRIALARLGEALGPAEVERMRE